MTISVWILGDQLLAEHPAIEQAVAEVGVDKVQVVMVESVFGRKRHPFHVQKLTLVFSAMRHYAAALRRRGLTVDYRQAATTKAGLLAHVETYKPEKIVAMAASQYNGRRYQTSTLPQQLPVPLQLLPNSQFLVEQFNPIPDPEPTKRYVMETFYRAMRRHFDVLMDGNKPVGDKWNFDHDNRKSLPKKVPLPEMPRFAPDEITQQVMAEVATLEGGVGSLDNFNWAVTHADAERAFNRFVAERFAKFGDYEDAMTTRSRTLFHSVISPYLNLGLLTPLDLVRRAEQAYDAGRAPLNAVEGFVRQILGWREFMYWQYWRQMPGMKQKNHWQHTNAVPEWWWSGETEMNCLHHALNRTLKTGYTHHIERLMLLGNYAFLARLDPLAVNDWFMAMYVDAYDWVMPPNVIGMSLNADGGLTATKPYFSSANYINKMGDYCKPCRFNPKKRTGEDACPFNTLYWHFVMENQDALRRNNRTQRMVWGLRHLDSAEMEAITRAATEMLS